MTTLTKHSSCSSLVIATPLKCRVSRVALQQVMFTIEMATKHFRRKSSVEPVTRFRDANLDWQHRVRRLDRSESTNDVPIPESYVWSVGGSEYIE